MSVGGNALDIDVIAHLQGVLVVLGLASGVVEAASSKVDDASPSVIDAHRRANFKPA